MTPEPKGPEREALDRALRHLLEPETHPAYRSAWRHAAIHENAGLDDRATPEVRRPD